MENPFNLVMFGDSIVKGCTETFEKELRNRYKEKKITVVNAGVGGETSSDGLLRLKNILNYKPKVVLIGFGMNDWRKGVNKKAFRKNIIKIIDTLEKEKIRVVLMSIIPSYHGIFKGTDPRVDEYNKIIRNIAKERGLKLADVNAVWRKKIRPIWRGLSDSIHPNKKGYRLISEVLMDTVPREYTTILFGYDGCAAPCNYRCPYCSDWRLKPKISGFKGPMKKWRDAFKRTFGNQHLVFYVSYGEPMLGKYFYDLLDMIASEPNWRMMMTSNLSQKLDRLVKAKLVKEGRLNINASFHPTETTIEKFLEKLLFLRKHGIECPVVYVMYPPHMNKFEKHFNIFNKHGFVVHVRAFDGIYKGKLYPMSYTNKERMFISKYADDATIKHMLNRRRGWGIGKEAYHGTDYFFITNEGNVGTDYSCFRCLGNILDGTFERDFFPQPLKHMPEKSVTDVSSMKEVGYHQLEGNFVLSFARQGGVHHTNNGVYYKHMNTDFTNKKIRREYGFPGRLYRININPVSAIRILLYKFKKFRKYYNMKDGTLVYNKDHRYTCE